MSSARPFPDRLDRIMQDVEELKRRQQTARIQQYDEYTRQLCANMSDEIKRIRDEDWKEPEDLMEFARTGEMREVSGG